MKPSPRTVLSLLAGATLASCMSPADDSPELGSTEQAISVASASRFTATASLTTVHGSGLVFPASFQADRLIAIVDTDRDGVIDTASGSRTQTFPSSSAGPPFAAGSRIGSSGPGSGFCGDLVVLATDTSGPLAAQNYFIWIALRTPGFVVPAGCHPSDVDMGAGAIDAFGTAVFHHETVIGGMANSSFVAGFTGRLDLGVATVQYPGRLTLDVASAQLNQVTGGFNSRINLANLSLDVPVIGEAAWDGFSTFRAGAVAASAHPHVTLATASATLGTEREDELLLHWADVTGDGRADFCMVEEQEVACAIMGTDGLLGVLHPWSTELGWRDLNQFPYWRTLQFPDLDADGDADICAYTSSGIRCARSTRTGFAASTMWETSMNDSQGWRDASRFPTIKFPDVNGDGRADLCARYADGMHCAVGDGFNGFHGMALTGARFSDARGWNVEDKWATIQYGDLDGDRRADVCARGTDGIYCARSLGNGFEPDRRWHDNFRDSYGWNQWKYYSTIALGDVNRDGIADLCGRGTAGMYCTPSLGGSFAPSLTLAAPMYSDLHGWGVDKYAATIMLIDITGDGAKDICGRGSNGIWCANATPVAGSRSIVFAPAALRLAAFGDDPHRTPGTDGVGDNWWWNSLRATDVDTDAAQEICAVTPWGVECTR